VYAAVRESLADVALWMPSLHTGLTTGAVMVALIPQDLGALDNYTLDRYYC
jgi:hypothetical protein